jgi:hypothetical protein
MNTLVPPGVSGEKRKAQLDLIESLNSHQGASGRKELVTVNGGTVIREVFA